MSQGQLNIRVPEELKDEAVKTLDKMGLTPSAAVRIFLTQVVNSRSIPFAIAGGKDKKENGGRKVD